MTFDRRGPVSGTACLACDSFGRRDLVARLDDCITALEAAAACFALVQPRGETPADWDDLRAVEDRFAALRCQIDDLALSALRLTDCCEAEVVPL